MSKGRAGCEQCGGAGWYDDGDPENGPHAVKCYCTEEREPKWWDDGKVEGVDDYSDWPPDWVQERADAVRQAQAMIGDAIDMIEAAIKDTPFEDNIDAYVVAHLKTLARADHGYCCRDANLDDVIRMLEGRTDEVDW